MSSRRAPAGIAPACLLILLSLATAACHRAPASAPPVAAKPVAEVETPENGAISVAPVAPAAETRPDVERIDWSPIDVVSGEAWLACDLDYARDGERVALAALDRDTITAALEPCADTGVLRLRYRGRIATDFVALVQRVASVAEALDIGKRVMDIDSSGGQVEDAIRAGDHIAETRWTIWVREDSRCHSACVFVLSAGDVRRIAGRVGIHRIIRMSSTATTRAELNAELRLVYERVRGYLERNGASVAVADLMMAVPNRSLRLLTDDELLRFGLDGVNAAQDDLDRLRLLRECGQDFVARRDAFAGAFDRKCRRSADELEDLNACGLALRKDYGFPDAGCPAESPLSEFDLAQDEPEPVEPVLDEAVQDDAAQTDTGGDDRAEIGATAPEASG